VICAALCVNISIDSTDTSEFIRGCNIFSGQEDPSVLFDFSVEDRDLFNFYLINTMKNNIAVQNSFFDSSTDEVNKGYVRSYEFEFETMMKNELSTQETN
jgi:hypothetical protein